MVKPNNASHVATNLDTVSLYGKEGFSDLILKNYTRIKEVYNSFFLHTHNCKFLSESITTNVMAFSSIEPLFLSNEPLAYLLL